MYESQSIPLRWPTLKPFFFFLILKTLFFRGVLQTTNTTVRRYRICHILFISTHALPFPVINIPHQRSTFGTTDRPTLTQQFPESLVYLRIHSWCTLYGFAQMYSDLYLSSHYHKEQFHCPENLCCVYSFLQPHNPWQPVIFVLSLLILPLLCDVLGKQVCL